MKVYVVFNRKMQPLKAYRNFEQAVRRLVGDLPKTTYWLKNIMPDETQVRAIVSNGLFGTIIETKLDKVQDNVWVTNDPQSWPQVMDSLAACFRYHKNRVWNEYQTFKVVKNNTRQWTVKCYYSSMSIHKMKVH